MPTAGRLVAAIALAIVAAYFAFITDPLFSEGETPKYWWPICVLAGVWSGWVVIGKRAGQGYRSGFSSGLTGGAAMVFWILFIVSVEEMIRKSVRRSYDGPMEAAVDIFQIMIDYAQPLATTDVALALIVGSILAGLIAEFFAKRFP